MLALLALLACAVACRESASAGPYTCPDPGGCDRPLPASDPQGQPWPTFDEALADGMRCTSGIPGPFTQGSCADGKRFVDLSGAFGGETRFFRGQQLVGIYVWSDIVSECGCNPSVQGDTECESQASEGICGPVADACAPYLGASHEAVRCTDSGELQSTFSTGDWSIIEICAGGAAFCNSVYGGCNLGPCEAGETRCNGAAFERCRDDRTAWDVVAECSSPAQRGPKGCD